MAAAWIVDLRRDHERKDAVCGFMSIPPSEVCFDAQITGLAG